MDYIRIYTELMDKAKHREYIFEYHERHHILPKSLGGTDNWDNLVELTLQEHCLAHTLLAKAGFDNQWNSVACFYEDNNPNRRHLKYPRWVRKRCWRQRQLNLRNYLKEELKTRQLLYNRNNI